MGIPKKYNGYTSYSYLDKGDYEQFDLANWNWAGENLLPLTEAEEARVLEMAEKNVIISLHEHANLFPRDTGKTMAYNRAGRHATSYEGLAASYLDCVFDNMMDGTNTISSKCGWKWQDIIHDLGMRLCDIAHQDLLIPCRRVEDIHRAHREGKIAWVPVIEGAAPIENEVDRIDILYGLGVRQLGVTYSEANALGCGIREDNDGGLTAFGRRCVRRMNQVGMLPDISHCGTKTALDVVECSELPLIASHTGAKGVWNTKRLFDDELIKAVAAKGGVIGIEAAPHTTMSATNNTHDLHSVMEHFEYVRELVGIDHVSFGADTTYGDHVGLHHTFAATLSTASIMSGQPYDEVPFVWGMENPTEASWNVVRYLVKQGYSDEDIAKVLGGNALRVLEQVWK